MQILLVFVLQNKFLLLIIQSTGLTKQEKNIAGRLPENSRNRFVDRQSKKTVKKTGQKNRLFIEG